MRYCYAFLIFGLLLGTSGIFGQVPAAQTGNKPVVAQPAPAAPQVAGATSAAATLQVPAVQPATPAPVQPVAIQAAGQVGPTSAGPKPAVVTSPAPEKPSVTSSPAPVATKQTQPAAPMVTQPVTAAQVPLATQVPSKPQPVLPALPQQAPIPPAPAPAQPKPAPLAAPVPAQFKAPGKAPEVEKEQPQGIDTMNVADAQGNWLFKRMWWQRAETQYEKIKQVVDAIMESRMAFFGKRTEWDKTIFDPFYQESGLGRGVLEELIGSMISQLSQERAHQGQLDEKERTLLSSLESQKEALEQLQKDVQKINEIDNAIDEAISVLIKQINAARNFERQSWQNFKAIAQELNDKKARDLYYGMVTYWQNINEIGQYIQMPFLQHFEKLGNLAKEQTEKVSGALKAMKEKGIDFKKQWQEVEENNMRQKQAHDYKEGVEEGKKEEEAKIAAEQGIFARILSTISNTLSTSWDYIKSMGQTVWDFTIGRFFGKKAEAKTYEAGEQPTHPEPAAAPTVNPAAPATREPEVINPPAAPSVKPGA